MSLWFMVFITIVTGAYKPTYILGASHCMFLAGEFSVAGCCRRSPAPIPADPGAGGSTWQQRYLGGPFSGALHHFQRLNMVYDMIL